MGLISRVSSRTYRNSMTPINITKSAHIETILSISNDSEFNREAVIECLHEYKNATSQYQQYQERERQQIKLYETQLSAMKLDELHAMLRISIDKTRLSIPVIDEKWTLTDQMPHIKIRVTEQNGRGTEKPSTHRTGKKARHSKIHEFSL